jgi:hypothetical protein
MKFFGFLLSTHHHKSSNGGGKAGHSQWRSNSASLSTVALVVAKVLLDADLMERCFVLLQAILLDWMATGADESAVVVGLPKQPLAPSAFELSKSNLPRTFTPRRRCCSARAVPPPSLITLESVPIAERTSTSATSVAQSTTTKRILDQTVKHQELEEKMHDITNILDEAVSSTFSW